MVKYVFREDGPAIVHNRTKETDPQTIGEALEEARRATPEGGDIRETVLKLARKNPAYPLYPYLEWDGRRAAHEYRKYQLSLLICAIRVEDDNGVQRPAFISIRPADGAKRFSTPTEIVGSYELQDALLRAADRDLANWTARYRMLSDICEIVHEARERLAERRGRDAGDKQARHTG